MPIPALMDLAEDVEGGVPIGFAKAWSRGERTEERALELLAPHAVRGTLVRTDTPGVKDLTDKLPTAKLLSMISRPKEILHGLGVAVGGTPVGRWVADNALLFFPEDVPVDTVLRAVHDVHRRRDETMARIGMCVHHGQFYAVGGGMYGPDAWLANHVGEFDTRPGETLVSEAVREALDDAAAWTFEARDDLKSRGAMATVVDGPDAAEIEASDLDYPGPYDAAMRERLRELAEGRDAEEVGVEIEVSYQHERAMLVIERVGTGPERSALSVLEHLSGNASIHRIVRFLVADGGLPYKVAGRRGIVAYPTARDALSAARTVADTLGRRDIDVRIGIEVGEVLIFSMDHGQSEFTGDALNWAMRLAEVAGAPRSGCIARKSATGLTLPQAELEVIEVEDARLEALRFPL